MSATSTQTSIDFALGIPLRLKCSPLPRHVESREVASLLEGDRTFLEDLGGRIALKAPQVKVEVTRKEGNAWAGELWSARGEVSGVRFVVEAVPSDFVRRPWLVFPFRPYSPSKPALMDLVV